MNFPQSVIIQEVALRDGLQNEKRVVATADKLRSLRNHGSRKRYYHDEIGYNSRLDELQAGVLRVKLKRIDAYNRKRRERAEQYSARLAGVPGITTPAELKGYFHVYHQYTILTKDRDRIMKALSEKGIASAVYYPVPLHLQDAYRDLNMRAGSLPQAEQAAREVLSLPMYPELTEAQIQSVADAVKKAL